MLPCMALSSMPICRKVPAGHQIGLWEGPVRLELSSLIDTRVSAAVEHNLEVRPVRAPGVAHALSGCRLRDALFHRPDDILVL